jgi:serine/threonine-protein kinase
VTSGDWAAVIVAIAALLVATLAVPARAPHRKAVFGVSGALVLIALAIGAVALVRGVAGDSGTGGISGTGRPSTTSAHSVQTGTSPSSFPSVKVDIDKADHVGRGADEVARQLSGSGLDPDVRTEQGGAPRDAKRCVVSDLEPAGEVEIGSRVVVTCVPT